LTRQHRHHVYVVELHRDVLYERRFRDANPRHDGFAPCVYVGMTGLSPERRFANHKAGVRANRYVQRFGLRLRPDLYAFFNPMPYSAACTLEAELAQEYRERGWAVWQA
jgi:predicted GIY-YIG superfamily endonuclease